MNKTHYVLGGNLKKSLTEGASLDLKQIFKDAFVITRKHYLPLIIACLVTVAIVATFYTLSLNSLSELSESNQLLINFIFSSVVIAPLVTGLQMMGINHAIGLKSRSADLFSFFNLILQLALASMMINIVVYILSVAFSEVLGDIGAKLSIIVMLYLNMTFCMVYPLIAEKKFSAALAIRLSFKLINKNLLQFTFLFILLFVLAIIALLPSGLGMFLFIPFYFNIMGIVYRQMCGVGIVATNLDDDNDSPGNGPLNNDAQENTESKNSSEFEA
ncbi:MAG: hypothetical protein V5786_10605 [Psychromonas sp.]